MKYMLLRVVKGCALLGVLLGVFLVMPAMAASVSGYTVESKIKMEGDQGWDLLKVEETSSRIFLSHGDKIDVVDATTGKAIGAVVGLKGAHDVALVPELNKGFATSGKDTTLVIFDMKTLAVLSRIPTDGIKPDAIIFDSASARVFVGLAGSNRLQAIDPASAKSIGTVSLEGNPELMAVDGKGMLYVAIENKSQVVAIDARSLKITATWALAPGEEPTGLAMDAITHKLFAGCNNHMLIVLDAITGKVETHLPIGEHIDGVAFDAGLKRIYASGGDGSLTVIQEDAQGQFTVLETVTTKRGARTIALDSKTHNLYLPTADYGPTPAATAENPKPRPTVLPGTFTVLRVSPRSVR